MTTTVPNKKQYPDVSDLGSFEDVSNALGEFFLADQGWSQDVSMFCDTDALVRNLATNISVPNGTGSVTVTFGVAQPDTSYAIVVEVSWNTTVAVTKTLGSFTLTFGTAPVGTQSLSWVLAR